MQRSLRVKSMAFILPGLRTMRRVSYMRARRLMVSVLRSLLVCFEQLSSVDIVNMVWRDTDESLFKQERRSDVYC